jgi:SAM-dependent methyltransferase
MATTQQALDQQNSQFWNELCGTVEAKKLGITDSSKASFARFDAWYLDYYPYLLPIVRPERMRDKKVLEIGLGYGTLGQQIAQAGADYAGMDLAQHPVDHMNLRLRMHGLPGRCVQGSALAMPFPDQSFEFLVSIGCMHHTGNLQQCFDETHRVLKPGGVAILMIYNKYSYMCWRRAPLSTLAEAMRGLFGRPHPVRVDSARQRCHYDRNTQGEAAPEVALTSVREAKHMLRAFATVTCSKRNAEQVAPKGIKLIPRSWMVPTVGRLLGLDIYIEARKGLAQAPALAVAA